MAYYVTARPGVDTADTNTPYYGMANYAVATYGLLCYGQTWRGHSGHKYL